MRAVAIAVVLDSCSWICSNWQRVKCKLAWWLLGSLCTTWENLHAVASCHGTKEASMLSWQNRREVTMCGSASRLLPSCASIADPVAGPVRAVHVGTLAHCTAPPRLRSTDRHAHSMQVTSAAEPLGEAIQNDVSNWIVTVRSDSEARPVRKI
eukprot:6185334-Pleurochrysis_carterae.AAC.1